MTEFFARLMLVFTSWVGQVPETERVALPDASYFPEARDPSSPIQSALVIYRTIRDCTDGKVVEPERKIFVMQPDGTRYRNYTCGNRRAEQCVGDRTRDRYYDERCVDHNGMSIGHPGEINELAGAVAGSN